MAELLTSTPLGVSTQQAASLASSLFGIDGAASRLPGERDDNFRITAAESMFSMKIANPAERPGVVEMQQLALEHVAATSPDLPTPRPLRTVRGALIGHTRSDERSAAVSLSTFLDGRAMPIGRSTQERRTNIGTILARLDSALLGFDHPEADRRYLWNLEQLADIDRYLHHLEADQFELVSPWLEHFVRDVEHLLAGLPRQVIHSDFNPENLLVELDDPVTIVGIIDFGDVMRSARVIDPAVAAAYECFAADDPMTAIADVVGAFHSETRLTAIEIDTVPELVIARLVQSLTIGAWRAHLHPENRRYILMHAEPAWNALRKVVDSGVESVRTAVHQTCSNYD